MGFSHPEGDLMSSQTESLRSTQLQELLRPRGRRYAGQPFDVSSRHSIQIVPQDESGELIRHGHETAVVDFFYHEGSYWRARIPLSGVEQVIGQAFNFSRPKTRQGPNGPELIVDALGVPQRKLPFVNHVQCRFKFALNQPIKLFPLRGDMSGAGQHELFDLIYSVEVVGPLGVRFNLRDAMCGNLISAHRILSIQEMVFERIVVENMYVLEGAPIPLDATKRRAALTAALLRSHRAGMNETYYLCHCWGTNNCTSTPLQEIDRIADYRLRHRIGSMLYRLPISPRLYLRLRGLDADPSVRKLVREEFRDYVGDPETSRRKREYVRQRTRALRALRSGARPAPSTPASGEGR
jgi:hypothetical protein